MSQLEELKTCHSNRAVLKKTKGWGCESTGAMP